MKLKDEMKFIFYWRDEGRASHSTSISFQFLQLLKKWKKWSEWAQWAPQLNQQTHQSQMKILSINSINFIQLCWWIDGWWNFILLIDWVLLKSCSSANSISQFHSTFQFFCWIERVDEMRWNGFSSSAPALVRELIK